MAHGHCHSVWLHSQSHHALENMSQSAQQAAFADNKAKRAAADLYPARTHTHTGTDVNVCD